MQSDLLCDRIKTSRCVGTGRGISYGSLCPGSRILCVGRSFSPQSKEIIECFKGFSQATNDFLWGIPSTTSALWFEAHKQTYLDHVQTPMRQLAQEVYEKFSARHEALPLMVRVSRIYRDARLCGRGGPTKAISGFPCVWLGTAGQNGRCCGLRSIPPATPMAWDL